MVDFYKLMNKIPAGTLLIPMLITAVINTFIPQMLTAPGGMTTALFKGGSLTFSALIAFSSGTGIQISQMGNIMRKSWALIVMKIILDLTTGFLFMNLFGLDGIGGINAISFIACMCATNPSIYLSCIHNYGEPSDMLTFVLSICLAQSAIPIFVITCTSGATFDLMPILSALIPFVLGVILGNLDPGLKKIYQPTTTLALPFLGFCFGASINLISALNAGLAGVLLAVIYLVIEIPCMLFADKILGKNPGYSAVAFCSVGGVTLTVPALLTDALYETYFPDAIAQIALCLIITCIVTPFICKITVKKWGAPAAF